MPAWKAHWQLGQVRKGHLMWLETLVRTWYRTITNGACLEVTP